jgi:hypothetical protein
MKRAFSVIAETVLFLLPWTFLTTLRLHPKERRMAQNPEQNKPPEKPFVDLVEPSGLPEQLEPVIPQLDPVEPGDDEDVPVPPL